MVMMMYCEKENGITCTNKARRYNERSKNE